MVFARALRPLVAVLAAGLASGCGNTSSYAPILIAVQAVAPVPQQTSFFNDTIPSGTTTILVTGLFLDSSSVVYVNGQPQKTTFLGDANIQLPDARAVNVDLDPAIASVAQQATLTAQGPDTPVSPPFAIGILEPQAHVTTLTPRQVPAGSGDTTLTWVGTGFNSSVQAVLDDAKPIPTTFVSATQVTAVLSAALLQAAAVHAVTLTEQQNCPLACQTFSDREFFTVGP